MTTKVYRETDKHFEHRLTVERNELARAIREPNYDRAASIAQYILQEIQVRRRD